MVFGVQYTQLMCNITMIETIIDLPTSPTYCCYTNVT